MKIDPKALEEASRQMMKVNRLDLAITAYKRAREAQGFVEVPKMPTERMFSRGTKIYQMDTSLKVNDYLTNIWRAMLAARPQKEGE